MLFRSAAAAVDEEEAAEEEEAGEKADGCVRKASKSQICLKTSRLRW